MPVTAKTDQQLELEETTVAARGPTYKVRHGSGWNKNLTLLDHAWGPI